MVRTLANLRLANLTVVLTTGLCLSCGQSDSRSKVGTRGEPDGAILESAIPAGKAGADGSFISRAGASDVDAAPRFKDVALAVGIDFQPFNDQVPGRFFLPEIMGSGAAWLDYDLDGYFDLYLANGRQLAPTAGTTVQHANQLFRQRGPGQFVSATDESYGGDRGFGQGLAAGDFDADGFPDLYLANYGHNVLLRNNGDGTFSDCTSAVMGGDNAWSSSVVWLDINGDSWLDLYVVNYVDATLANNKVCEANGVARYCGPSTFASVPDHVFLNLGDGTFAEAADELGLRGTDGQGLGVVAIDFDEDLRSEIYVANDMRPNFLFSRSRPGMDTPRTIASQFADCGFDAGCAVSDQGENEASMGIACGDFDGDRRPDIFLTHFLAEKNTLYCNQGKLMFSDESRRARIAASSFERLGFGTVAADFDHNGTLDLFVANGHVFGHLQTPHEMPPQILVNDGRGRFLDTSNRAGDYFQKKWLGRAAAGCDFDNDGDLDIAVTHVGKPVAILSNVTETSNHFIGFAFATRSRVRPVGGRIVVTTPARTQTLPIIAGGSYLTSPDPRILCGLGDFTGPVEVAVHWPSGQVDLHTFATIDRYWHLVEGAGVHPVP